MKTKTVFNLNSMVRENIKSLKPYQSAREELNEENTILLDANENPFPIGYNRYPDPFQRELKGEIAKQKGISSEQIFLGNGSDEIIDLLIRAFCEPQKDSIIINTPTYGMYDVCANINDIDVIKVELGKDFQLNLTQIFEKMSKAKIMFICSPNNPTGNIIKRKNVIQFLNNFNGIVVIDEAYIDFADEPGFLNELPRFPNLIVLQTFSKARAMAGIRLGMAFADTRIIEILNKIKYPYNISQLNQEAALKALQTNNLNSLKEAILTQKNKLIKALQQSGLVLKIWPSDANFLLVEFINHQDVFEFLKKRKIIVRDRSNEPKCEGCLRITVGTSSENNLLIKYLKEFEKLTIQNYEKNTIS